MRRASVLAALILASSSVLAAAQERLVNVYNSELQLQPTDSTALAHARELPMLKSEVPPPDIAEAKVGAKPGSAAKAQPVPMPAPRQAEEQEPDEIETGALE